MSNRATPKRQSKAERLAMGHLVMEGETELVAAVQRGEITARAALDRVRKRQMRERGNR